MRIDWIRFIALGVLLTVTALIAYFNGREKGLVAGRDEATAEAKEEFARWRAQQTCIGLPDFPKKGKTRATR